MLLKTALLAFNKTNFRRFFLAIRVTPSDLVPTRRWTWMLAIPSCFFLIGCGGGQNIETTGAIATRATVQAALYEICDGHYVFNDGLSDASSEIQACIDMGVDSIALPPGPILVDSQIKISKSITIRTARTENSTSRCEDDYVSCARIVAGSDFADVDGLVSVRDGQDIHLDHIIVDGNRIARLDSQSASECRRGLNRFGMNLTVQNCKNCSIKNSVLVNALCGTSLQWIGDSSTISNNLFARNGDGNKANMWADGLTVLRADDSEIYGNSIFDNSDVGLIVGGGRNLTVRDNMISQANTYAFAGLMLDNFNGSQSGEFLGARIYNNSIQCEMCFFAFNIGPLPWYRPPKMISGGDVFNNIVTGGAIGINVDGTSTLAPIRIFGNDLGDDENLGAVACRSGKTILSARLSVSSESFLTQDSTRPNVVQSTAGCI